MARKTRKDQLTEPYLLVPPLWEHIDVKGAVEHVLPTLDDAQLPWVNAAAHKDPVDPRVFASFIAFDRRGGGVWVMRGLLAVDSTAAVGVRQVTIEPYNPDGPLIDVQAADLRQRLGEIRDKAISQVHLLGQLTVEQWYGGAVWGPAAVEAAARISVSSSRAGRPALPDEHYEHVAHLYLELYGQGVKRGIIAELAERMSTPDHAVPRETARDWIKRSRDLGFLSPGKQGRAGAVPGPRLLPDTTQPKEETDG